MKRNRYRMGKMNWYLQSRKIILESVVEQEVGDDDDDDGV
jgi:hypothetical protein